MSLGAINLAANGDFFPVFNDGVLDIFALSSGEQVIRVDAIPHIASVTYEQSFRDAALVKLEAKSMRRYGHAF